MEKILGEKQKEKFPQLHDYQKWPFAQTHIKR